MRKENVYALYKGDTFIDLGTAKELAQRLGISPKSIQFMNSPSYQKRINKRTRESSEGYMILIKLQEDLEDDYSRND